MTIPVTLIWSTLNRFVSSVSSLLDLELEIGREIFKQISDGRLPTLLKDNMHKLFKHSEIKKLLWKAAKVMKRSSINICK